MKTLLILPFVALCSCAQFSGNGYKATLVAMKAEAYKQDASGVVIVGLDQTEVPVAVVNAVERVADVYIGGSVLKHASNNQAAVDLGEQATTRSIHESSEVTKRLKITEPTRQLGLTKEPPVLVP